MMRRESGPVVLGLAGGFGHDSAACLLREGKLESFFEEERLTRVKGAYGLLPVQAVRACLDETGVTVDDLDAVALSWTAKTTEPDRSPRDPHGAWLSRIPTLNGLPADRLREYPHHTCHAEAALWFAGLYEDAVCLVMDGRGENASTSVHLLQDGVLQEVIASPIDASLGSLYAGLSDYLGFGSGGQGRAMALAAFSGPHDELVKEFIVDQLQVRRIGSKRSVANGSIRHQWIQHFNSRFGPPRRYCRAGPLESFEDFHLRAAASVQHCVEELVVELVTQVRSHFGGLPVALTGGVALNCAMNGVLRRRHPDLDLWLNPVPHDSGGALGAARLASRALGRDVGDRLSPFLGRQYEDDAIVAELRRLGARFTRVADPAAFTATQLLCGRVVSWFQGPAEAGPRALGARSILGLASSSQAKVRLNSEVKLRERWRPFGPSILVEQASGLFGGHAFPFMIEAARVLPGVAEAFPAVVHVDRTSRPHTVAENHQIPRYRRLLEYISQDTGLGIVLNTSFNVGGEPIVYSPSDAVRTFAGAPIDALVIGDTVLKK